MITYCCHDNNCNKSLICVSSITLKERPTLFFIWKCCRFNNWVYRSNRLTGVHLAFVAIDLKCSKSLARQNCRHLSLSRYNGSIYRDKYFRPYRPALPRMHLCNKLGRKNGINALPSIMGWITSNTEKCSRVLGREVAYWIKSSRFESLLEARACDFFTLLVWCWLLAWLRTIHSSSLGCA